MNHAILVRFHPVLILEINADAMNKERGFLFPDDTVDRYFTEAGAFTASSPLCSER